MDRDVNTILHARGRRHAVSDFPGPLSIKTVLRGPVEWWIGRRRFEVGRESFLILNDRQPYSMSIDAREERETYCVFFARGFVEDAWRAAAESDATLLDEPFAHAETGFTERLYPMGGAVERALTAMRRHSDPLVVDGCLHSLARSIVAIRGEARAERSRIPAARASTREELHRRLLIGRAFLDGSIGDPRTLADAAREACLSPFHFHRLFRAAFGKTPHAYLVGRRLDHAGRLLRGTELPVTAISLESGFGSPAAFATVFRERFGRAPTEFRKNSKDTDAGAAAE